MIALHQPPASAPAPTVAARKAATNRNHAKMRAWQRYAIDLTAEDIETIEGVVRAGVPPRCVPLRPDHQGRPRPLYAVYFAGRWMPVIFDHATDSILTVLPDRVLDRYWPALRPKVESSDGRQAGPPRVLIPATPEGTELIPPDRPGGNIDLSRINGASTLEEIEEGIAEVNRRREWLQQLLDNLPDGDGRRRGVNARIAALNNTGSVLKFRRHIAFLEAKVKASPPKATLRAAREAILSLAYRHGGVMLPSEREALEKIEIALAGPIRPPSQNEEQP